MNIERATIGEIAKVKGGKRLPKGYAVQDEATEHPYLRVVDFDENGLNPSNVKFISNEVHEKIRRYVITDKDIFVSIAGTIGRVGIVPGLFSGANLTENAAKITDIHESVFGPFLYYFLRGYEGQAILKSKAGGTSQPKLALYRLAEVEFPKPLLETQRRIAWILANYDDLIENNRRRIELLEQAARGIYREWFVRLRFPGHERSKIVDGVPEGWKRQTISDVCDTLGGGTPSTKEASYWGGEITWIVPTDVTKNDCLVLLDSARKITERGLRESSASMVPAETILMTSRASVGFFALMDREVCTNQGFINVVPHEEQMRMYILFNLMSRVAEIRGNAKGTTYPEISKGRFRNLDIVIPDRNLVVEFANIAYDLVRQMRCLKRTTLELARARDLLLPRLMSGEIRV